MFTCSTTDLCAVRKKGNVGEMVVLLVGIDDDDDESIVIGMGLLVLLIIQFTCVVRCCCQLSFCVCACSCSVSQSACSERKTKIENSWTAISPRSGVCWSQNVHGRVACMDGRSIIFVRVCHIP